MPSGVFRGLQTGPFGMRKNVGVFSLKLLVSGAF